MKFLKCILIKKGLHFRNLKIIFNVQFNLNRYLPPLLSGTVPVNLHVAFACKNKRLFIAFELICSIAGNFNLFSV